jgi:hypothetical protein
VIPSDEARKAANAAVRAKAKAFAQDLAPVIAALRTQGITSNNAIARALTEQGIETSRGSSTWTATAVRRALATLAD